MMDMFRIQVIRANKWTSNICDVHSTRDSILCAFLKRQPKKMRVIIFVHWTFQRHFRAPVTFDDAGPGSECSGSKWPVSFTITSSPSRIFPSPLQVWEVHIFPLSLSVSHIKCLKNTVILIFSLIVLYCQSTDWVIDWPSADKLFHRLLLLALCSDVKYQLCWAIRQNRNHWYAYLTN